MCYTECLPLNCLTLLRRATLGHLPRKTCMLARWPFKIAVFMLYVLPIRPGLEL